MSRRTNWYEVVFAGLLLIGVSSLLSYVVNIVNVPGNDPYKAVEVIRGRGTGFYLKHNDQYVFLTAAHICGGAYALEVGQNGDQLVVLAGDTQNDLCALSPLNAEPENYAVLGKAPQEYQQVWVLGYPYLLKALTTGYVVGFDDGLVRTTATVHPGSSGSPVFSSNQTVVGLVVTYRQNVYHSESVRFETLKSFVEGVLE